MFFEAIHGSRRSHRSAMEVRSPLQGPEISIVVPLYNEQQNVAELVREICAVAGGLDRPWELILIDDGSDDDTFEIACHLAEHGPYVRVLRFARNFGQTAAIQAGFDHSRGDVVITMDGDLQNDPHDIPELLRQIDEGYDVVCGWRRERHDAWLRTNLSRVANGMISRLTGVDIHDHGCTLKAYRREFVKRTKLYSDLHRFVLVVMSLSGCTYKELEVRHRARRAGISKYGFSRIWKVVLDLMTLVLLSRLRMQPMRRFVVLSLPFLLLGVVFLFASGVLYTYHAGGDGFPIVYPGAAILFLFAFFHLFLVAVVAELVVWSGDFREAKHLVLHGDLQHGEDSEERS